MAPRWFSRGVRAGVHRSVSDPIRSVPNRPRGPKTQDHSGCSLGLSHPLARRSDSGGRSIQGWDEPLGPGGPRDRRYPGPHPVSRRCVLGLPCVVPERPLDRRVAVEPGGLLRCGGIEHRRGRGQSDHERPGDRSGSDLVSGWPLAPVVVGPERDPQPIRHRNRF